MNAQNESNDETFIRLDHVSFHYRTEADGAEPPSPVASVTKDAPQVACAAEDAPHAANATADAPHATSISEDAPHAAGVIDLNLTIPKGQFVVLCGESGCGKTTLTRLINGLIPHYFEGELKGEIQIAGNSIPHQPLYDTAAMVGSVFQNPRSQFFNVDTTSEVTFGCENLGLPEDEIRRRLSTVTQDFHLESLLDRSIFQLSGGEKQKIACAGAAMMEPSVYVLDEPSSNLDAVSIRKLREILQGWKAQGKTVLISEHRLYYLHGLADRFLFLKGGKIAGDYTAAEFEALTPKQRDEMGLRAYDLSGLSGLSGLSDHRKSNFSDPLSAPSPDASQSDYVGKVTGRKLSPTEHLNCSVAAPDGLSSATSQVFSLRDFTFSYGKQAPSLHVTDCDIPAGEIVGIIGNNGAGKSTFTRCFCGLEKKCGTVLAFGAMEKTLRPKDRLTSCYMVMQDVNHQLFTESVLEEVLISMETEDSEWAEEILRSLDLWELRDRHPMSFSGGQKQRVAIASAMASHRDILFFDEPTSGLDYRHMKEVAILLRELQQDGKSVFVVSHDLELLQTCCNWVLYFVDGDIAEQFPMDEIGREKLREYFE